MAKRNDLRNSAVSLFGGMTPKEKTDTGKTSTGEKTSAVKIADAISAKHPAYGLRGRPRNGDSGSWGDTRGRKTTMEFSPAQYERITELSWNNRITFKETVFRLMTYGLRECERRNGVLSEPKDENAWQNGHGRKTLIVFDEEQYDRVYDVSCENHITRKEAVYRLLRLGIHECERRGGRLTGNFS